MPLTRDDIVRALRAELEPLPWAHALWEGGSAAFGRLDAWSDLDLALDVDDDRIEEGFERVEAALSGLSPIELRWRLPDPTWHGSPQAFYRLADAGEFLLVDICLVRSDARALDEVERHGTPIIHFDKTGASRSGRLDWAAHAARLEERRATLATTFELFQSLVKKAVARGQPLEAIAFYHSHTLRPLIEVLRMRHAPARHDFHARLLHHDLPRDLLGELERLTFVRDLEDLAAQRDRAEALFRETLAQLEREGA